MLLVEDDEFQRKLLTTQLESLGVKEVIPFTNGLEAIDQIKIRELYDALILLDLNMPIMDGVTFVSLLKDTPFRGSILLVSGEDERIRESTSRISKSYGLKVLGSLKKPISKEQLGSFLQKPLENDTPVKRARPERKKYSVERFRQAVQTGELYNEYQPKVDVKTGKLYGVEALVRWAHPDDGRVPPNEFISLAEENGLIEQLFEEVIDSAFSDWWQWAEEGLDISLALNVSIENLQTVNFIKFIENKIQETAFPAEKLILEITESTLMKEYELVLNILTRLRLRQVNLSIDDFGTGHSSMIQLRDIPFNELKLDRSFVHDASSDRVSQEIIHASMQLAQKLDIKTVAEGVEDMDDWNFLLKSDCDLAQGYFIGKPMPAASLLAWNEEWECKYKQLK